MISDARLVSIFPFLFILQDAEVTVVAGLGDEVFVEGREDGTTRLVGVGTVAEATIGGDTEDLFEVVAYGFLLEFDGAEAFDARGVDQER